MGKRSSIVLVLCLAVAGALPLVIAQEGGEKAGPAVTVTPLTIKETRYRDLAPDRKKSAFQKFANKPQLLLTVELSGEALKSATHYGKLALTEIKDDQGRALKPTEYGFNDPTKEYIKINREQMYFMSKDKPTDRIKFELKFDPPGRDAKALARVAGAVKLLVGEQKPIVFMNVKASEGKKLEHEELAKGGFTLDVLVPKKSTFGPKDPAKAIQVKLTGDKTKIMDVSVIDPQGKDVKTSKMWSSFSGATTYTFEARAGLPEGSGIKVILATSQEEVTVPIELANIPLP